MTPEPARGVSALSGSAVKGEMRADSDIASDIDTLVVRSDTGTKRCTDTRGMKKP